MPHAAFLIPMAVSAVASVVKHKMDVNAANKAAAATGEAAPATGSYLGSAVGGAASGAGGGSNTWIGPAIGAAGSVAGAYLASRGQNKATDATSKATAEALAYQMEKDAYSQKQYEAALAQYHAERQALLNRYGISIPQTATSLSGSMPASGAAPNSLAMPVSNSPGNYVRGGQPLAVDDTITGQTVDDQQGGNTLKDIIARSNGRLGNAFDWSGMGLGSTQRGRVNA